VPACVQACNYFVGVNSAFEVHIPLLVSLGVKMNCQTRDLSDLEFQIFNFVVAVCKEI
jgi:hypothetical protein